MLAFVTSVRHPDVSSDYSRTEAILEASLRSVSAQVDKGFFVIVVGNRAPSFALPENAYFAEVDWPAPTQERLQAGIGCPSKPFGNGLSPYARDKGRKLAVGVGEALRRGTDFVMTYDCDDFVSGSLARFVNSRIGEDGWYFERGHVYSARRNVLRTRRAFHRYCGTSHILGARVHDGLEVLSYCDSPETVESVAGDRLERILARHTTVQDWCLDHGITLSPLPFPGAVYLSDSGDNLSGVRLRGLAKPLTAGTAAEFGMSQNVPTWLSALSAFDPRELPFSTAEAVKGVGRMVMRSGRRLASAR